MDEERCPISWEDFVVGEQICQIKECEHIFKSTSLLNWLRTNSHCPVCRYDLRTYNGTTPGRVSRTTSNRSNRTRPNSSGDRRSPTELVVGGVNAPLPDYDVCMLAYIVQEAAEIPGNTVVGRVLNGQTAAGYIVNGKYLDVLIELYEWAIPLLEQTNEHWNYANDHVWKRLQPKDNWVYMLKRLGKQRDSYSDNKMCYVTPNT